MSDDVIAGIDLGTTNSEIAVMLDGQIRIVGSGGRKMLPSCVGVDRDGRLLVGAAAVNQLLLYPDNTVRSVKRSMGDTDTFTLGGKDYSPPEISAVILKELVSWAAAATGAPVTKAVITVPAYFSDAQRQATREAGAMAGLDVLRILNEPTAASLAYGVEDDAHHTVMVYDLGGGTFDVSIVNIEGPVTEVVASHGNNHLGGDDFDRLIIDHAADVFKTEHDVDLRDDPRAASRLRRAAEAAKKELSQSPYATIAEEAIITVDGVPRHLKMELSREEYEEMIRPLIEKTLESVSTALSDAGMSPDDIDEVLLAGGSTRTPLIQEQLRQRTGTEPRRDVHPDLCVALGAGVMASRTAGHDIDRVLVDVTPYSFGPSYLGDLDGMSYPHCYAPLIRRNSPLPVRCTKSYYTATPYQEAVHINIYQGEDPDAMNNIPVGDFHVEGLDTGEECNEILCRMELDIDGILKVSAIEKKTGLEKRITITNATARMTDEQIAASREKMEHLYGDRAGAIGAADAFDGIDDPGRTGDGDPPADVLHIPDGAGRDAGARSGNGGEDAGDTDVDEAAAILLERSRRLLDTVHEEDREEMIDLNEQLEKALAGGNGAGVSKAAAELKELLFFVEGE